MPTIKDLYGPKESVSELKLDVAKTQKLLPRLSARPGKKPSQVVESCGTSISDKTMSRNNFSIQSLEFPDDLHKKPVLKVQSTSPTLIHEKISKSTPLVKRRGYDSTTSTNSNFDGRVSVIPSKFKRKSSFSSSTPSPVTSSLKTSIPNETNARENVATSRETIGSARTASSKSHNFNGPEWKRPCKESFVAGAPRSYIGTCLPRYEDLAKMSKTRQKFYLTQDPRKKYCLRNPEVLHKKAYSENKEYDALTKLVKHADNLCGDAASQSSESFICEMIDLENPLQLDFQGMDYKNTYEKDEQDVQNQRVYRGIVRYMDRKRIKAQTQLNVKEEQQRERLAVPACFEVTNRNDDKSSTTTEESVHYGKLYRSGDKPYNKQIIVEEDKRRRDRYNELYRRKQKRHEEEEKQHQKLDKADKQNLATTLALKNFNAAVDNINKAIQQSFKNERLLRRNEIQRRIFPQTLREMQLFKKSLKMKNRIKRDEAKVKQEFFKDRLGVGKTYPEAELEISSETLKHSTDSRLLSEKSSDDEDALEVGKKGELFKLRGFHYKLGDGLRGKRHQRELTQGTRQRGCITREQWLSELAPKKEQVKLDVEVGIEKIESPDDPQLVIFHRQFGYKVPKVETSAVKEYVQRRLGRHYERTMRKNLKLVKPRLLYSVKKFNLISFLYGETEKQLREIRRQAQEKDTQTAKMKTTLEYMEAKDTEKKHHQRTIKQERLKLLGIPCREVKKSRLQTLCENSESDSGSAWAPDPEPEVVKGAEDFDRNKMEKLVTVSQRMRGNMPAPKHREATLRRNPRHPRDYQNERVPSLLFDEAVKTTGIPHLQKLPEDLLQYANVNLKKRPYTDMFDARHHHDHWNPTQLKPLNVHYQANIVKPEVTKVKSRIDQVTMEHFHMANPPCNAYVDMDLTMPKWDTDAMIADHLKKSKRFSGDTDKVRTKDICYTRDFVYRSRSGEDLDALDYPGHREYLNFLKKIRDELNVSKVKEDGQEELLVDKAALVRELEEDLKSIESCLTSLDSSVCTNLTNDSGSFLLMDGKTKVPLDYIRKSLIPFEELQRSRFQVVPIDVDAEDANPFKMVPFAGQKKAQLELKTAKDSFFTFNTRLQNGLRLRLEVPIEDVRQKLLGRGVHKFPGLVSTDIDENYVDELKNRPSVKLFKFKTGRWFIKDALRLKFESMLIQGQIVRTKIYDRLNEQHWESMQKCKLLYEKLFAKWEKHEYEAAMSIVYQVKSYYEITDILKKESRSLDREIVVLNMDIVFIEGHWIRRIMLQKFHYLLGQVWRYENDWKHRTDEFGSFDDSTTKRNIVKVRQGGKDDAWAIKTFYEEVYLKDKHPILIVFSDAQSFLKGIENLKVKTFVSLLELHFILAIHTELQGRLEIFVQWCIQDLKEKKEYVERKCSKKYFMEDRAMELKRRTEDFLDSPIEESFNDDTFNRDRAVISEVWREIVPSNIRGSSDQDLEPIEMVAMMSDVVAELLGKFELIPMNVSHKIEQKLRRRTAYLKKLSHGAYQVEKRIEIEMKKVRHNLEPPFQKPNRKDKLPRYYLKKKVKPVVVQERHVSEHTKFFFRAFHSEGDVMQQTDARESVLFIDTMQEQIVPFYFDHFLKLNGYTPNYNFKTQIELRDGPELDRLQVRELVPEVQDRIEKWEAMRKRQMEDTIAKNPKMYENVMF